MTADTNSAADRKRPAWAKWWFVALLLLVAISLSLSLWLTVAGDPANQFTISPETTVLTEPLTDDGLVDYAEAIRRRNREEVPPEQNAARLLLEAIGPQAFNNDEQAQQAYEQLEMEPLPESDDGQYVICLRDMLEEETGEKWLESERLQCILDDQLPHCMSVPWSGHEAPEIAEWIAINSVPLEKVHAASLLLHYRAPVIDSPNNYLIGMLLPMVNSTREFGRLLTARAMHSIAHGDVSSAWDDIHCAHQLAALHSQGYTVIEHFVACALSSIAANAMPALLASPEMTPELLTQIRNDCDELRTWNDVSEIIDTTERYMVLDFIQRCPRDGASAINLVEYLDEFELPEHPVMAYAVNACVDWDSVMIHANDCFDQSVRAFREHNVASRGALIEQIDVDRHRLFARAYDVSIPWLGVLTSSGDRVLKNLWGSMEHTHETLLRRDARFALVDTALAIEQFRFEHVCIPDSLAELVPEYLDAVPLDPCAPQDELRYVVHPDDAYVLYSVSDNGVDDGGTSVRDDVIFQVRMPVPEMPRFVPAGDSEATAGLQ